MSLLEHPTAQALLADAEISAASVRGCSHRLERFLQRYLPCFYRKEQRVSAGLFGVAAAAAFGTANSGRPALAPAVSRKRRRSSPSSAQSGHSRWFLSM